MNIDGTACTMHFCKYVGGDDMILLYKPRSQIFLDHWQVNQWPNESVSFEKEKEESMQEIRAGRDVKVTLKGGDIDENLDCYVRFVVTGEDRSGDPYVNFYDMDMVEVIPKDNSKSYTIELWKDRASQRMIIKALEVELDEE